MVLIEINGNYISMEPMRSREAGEMVRVYNIIIQQLRRRGIESKRQILDNEAFRNTWMQSKATKLNGN
jgi:hypothetical protein